MKTFNNDDVRKTVKQAYTNAISKTEKSCCVPSCCTPSSAPLVQGIGYSAEELTSVPAEAAQSSFGCGNPLAFAEVQRGQTVVDLGSGAGLDLLLAAEKVGSTGRVIGIDMTDAMIETARANIKRAGAANVEVRKGLIEEMPVEDSSVDWVISNCVINLSPEKDRVFKEVFRVLKPGGAVQVSDIMVEDVPEWIRGLQDLFTACVGGAISESEYLKGMHRAGLSQAEVIERVVFDATTIRFFLESKELQATGDGFSALSSEEMDRTAEALAGKVLSAKVRARKP